MIVDQRGGFKSEGKPPTPAQGGDDLFALIEWAASREWSNGNVGMVGVSALAMNQYDVASRQPPPPHLKAIIPWEGTSDMYRDLFFGVAFLKQIFPEVWGLSRQPWRSCLPIRPRRFGPLPWTLLVIRK